MLAKQAMHHITLEGPDGQIAHVRAEAGGRSARVYVPDGTRSLRAVLETGCQEFPIGSATRIVIE